MRLVRSFVLCVLAAGAVAPASRAQVSLTFRMESGRLFVDGREDSRFRVDELPGRQVYTFTGPLGSTVEVRGVRYRLAGPGGLALDTQPEGAPDAIFLPFRPTRLAPQAVAFIAASASSSFAAHQEMALEEQALRLADYIRGLAPGAERTALVGQLRLHLTQTFDVKQALRARDIEALEAELKQAREALQRRQFYRDGLVERRLVELVGTGM